MWRRVLRHIPVLPVVLFTGVFVIFADLAWGGVLQRLDESVAAIWPFQGATNYPTADFFDMIGQRSVCLPILFGIAYLLSRRLRSVRPLLIAAMGTVALNFFVGVVKIVTSRQSPRTGTAMLFEGNNLFPSGHTANVVFVYGLAVALILRYGTVTAHQRLLLVSAVIGIFVFMTTVSIYRHTHWFTDLMAGGMVGAAVLDMCMRADAFWPNVRRWLKRVAGPSWAGVEWFVRNLRAAVVRSGDRKGAGSAGLAGGAGSTNAASGARAARRPTPAARRVGVVSRSSGATAPGYYEDYVVTDEIRRREPTISGWR